MKRINNTNSFTVNSGPYVFLLSYKTVVAYYRIKTRTYYVTDEKFSATTTRHINSFVSNNKKEIVSQESIESLFAKGNNWNEPQTKRNMG